MCDLLSAVVPEKHRWRLFPCVYPSLEKMGRGFDRFARAHDSYEIWGKTRGVGRRMKAFAFPEMIESGGE